MKATSMRSTVAWTYLMIYLVGLGLALSQITSVQSIVAVTMIPSLIVGFFGVLIAFWISSDEANIQELQNYLGPSIKEKEDMLKRLIVEKENLGRNDGSMVIKDADSPQPQKTG